MPGEGSYGPEEAALIAELDRRVAQYGAILSSSSNSARRSAELRAIWVAGNEYLTRAAPWTHIKTDRDKAAVGVRMGLNLVHLFGHLAWPVMPTVGRAVHEAINPRRTLFRGRRNRWRSFSIPSKQGSRLMPRRFCSPRSPTSKSRSGKRASGVMRRRRGGRKSLTLTVPSRSRVRLPSGGSAICSPSSRCRAPNSRDRHVAVRAIRPRWT